ncbi:MAG: GNAT family N-acetyltransferase [Oscillospiraceae bacterium]|nr:GNAT family N-acetyltransferase [Oscillospiraceae bacterium]
MRIVRHTKNDNEFEASWNIRVEVFVKEQNVPIGLELDEHDETAVHVLAYDNDEPVGCGRLVFFDEYAQIGRVAVLQSQRKLGVGKAICEELMAIAVERQAKKVTLHAQLSAEKFYKKLGFTPEGEVFLDAGIDHINMFKLIYI